MQEPQGNKKKKKRCALLSFSPVFRLTIYKTQKREIKTVQRENDKKKAPVFSDGHQLACLRWEEGYTELFVYKKLNKRNSGEPQQKKKRTQAPRNVQGHKKM